MSLVAPVYPFSKQPIQPNPNLDLTTVQAVHDYAQVNSATDDNLIQLTISAFSQEFIRMTGRSNMDGTTPRQSPYVAQQYYEPVCTQLADIWNRRQQYVGTGHSQHAGLPERVCERTSHPLQPKSTRPRTQFHNQWVCGGW